MVYENASRVQKDAVDLANGANSEVLEYMETLDTICKIHCYVLQSAWKGM
jgi:hypothetical protein